MHDRKVAYSISSWEKHGCGEKNFSKCFPRSVCLDCLRELGIFKIYYHLSLLSVLVRDRKLAYSISSWEKQGCGEKKFSKCFPRPVRLDLLGELGIS